MIILCGEAKYGVTHKLSDLYSDEEHFNNTVFGDYC